MSFDLHPKITISDWKKHNHLFIHLYLQSQSEYKEIILIFIYLYRRNENLIHKILINIDYCCHYYVHL